MSFCASIAARIASRKGFDAVRARVAALRLGSEGAGHVEGVDQRTAVEAATPNRSAAARRDMPPATAAISLERRSSESGLAMHAGLLPSTMVNHIETASGNPQ